MGLYFTKCTKCGRTWWFCSVDYSTGGEPCNCDEQYHKWCDSFGNVIDISKEWNISNYVSVPFPQHRLASKRDEGVVLYTKQKNRNTISYRNIRLVRRLCTAHYR